MSEANVNETQRRDTTDAVVRRALVVADEGAGADSLMEKLSAVGFEVARASVEEAARRAKEVKPSVVLLAFGKREGESRLITLARRLRAEATTLALPVVFLFRTDERTLRSAAAHVGADDYFAQYAPPEELRARLEALLWRAEAGRRNAPTVAEQRSEIDNFIFLLDSVGADARLGRTGTLALIEVRRNAGSARRLEAKDDNSRDAGAHSRDTIDNSRDAANSQTRADDRQTLAAAQGFLKLNLRRVDAVAFYGPATLLVYLPGARSDAARSALAALGEEFLKTDGGDLIAGLSSFPAHGTEIEGLVERAEAALERARAENSTARIFVYDTEAAVEQNALITTPDEISTGTPSVTSDEAGALAALSEARSGDGVYASSRTSVASQSGEPRRGARTRRMMLVVSDAARMAQVNLLLRSEGYEVRAAFDGQHALNLLRIDSPDLLLVDYELRGMDGVEMLRRLSKQSGATTTPALVMLPAGREDLRREAREAGARAVVQLPYDPVELLERLRDFGETE
jgi:DNA-binding response OmpR family regulator